MLRRKPTVQIGDRFKKRGHAHKVYAIDRFLDFADHPQHVCLVAAEHGERVTIALSALLDGDLFEPVEAGSEVQPETR